MSRRLRTGVCLGLVSLLAASTTTTDLRGAQFSATWLGGSDGLWSNGARWTTNPAYPNDGTFTYDATINSDTVTLDRNIAIQHFALNGGNVAGAFNLTLDDGISSTMGNIAGSGSLALAAGSASSIAAPAGGGSGGARSLVGRTLNNAGSVSQSAYLGGGGGAIINNLAGATWTLQGTYPSGLGISDYSGSTPFAFNNAGGVVVAASSQIDIFVPFNNSGNVALQPPNGSNFTSLRLNGGGSSGGSFSVPDNSLLAFNYYSGNNDYTLTAGATISSNGSMTIMGGTLNVASNATIGTAYLSNTGGTLAVQSGATLSLTGSNPNRFGGTVRLSGGTITSAQPLTLSDTYGTAGTLTGSGTINAGLSLTGGTVSPGTLTINGSYTQSATK